MRSAAVSSDRQNLSIAVAWPRIFSFSSPAARLLLALGLLSLALPAQTPPRFEVDPSWPKPLPEGWIFGRVGGVCVDSHDHIAVVDRRDITDEEAETSKRAPPIVMFDAVGGVVKSIGDPDAVPQSIHGCFFDRQDNIWVAGNGDGIIQKYSHEGKLLLQVGKRGFFDTSPGARKPSPLCAKAVSGSRCIEVP